MKELLKAEKWLSDMSHNTRYKMLEMGILLNIEWNKDFDSRDNFFM
jgi:hypothetical protein